MPNKTSPQINLSARSRKIVAAIARRRSTQSRLVIRALLLSAMADDIGNNELPRQHEMDRAVVRKWRNRWVDLVVKLQNAEAAETSAEELRDLRLTGLSDLPRSGTPPKFTAEQRVPIIAVAGEAPVETQRPVSHWTPSELADEVVKRQIVASLAPASVGRFF